MKKKISIRIPDDYNFRMELAETVLNLLQNPLERNSYSIAFDADGDAEIWMDDAKPWEITSEGVTPGRVDVLQCIAPSVLENIKKEDYRSLDPEDLEEKLYLEIRQQYDNIHEAFDDNRYQGALVEAEQRRWSKGVEVVRMAILPEVKVDASFWSDPALK